MLYTDNLEDIIFSRHELIDANELIVLSGYLGPKPVEKLSELPFKSKVIHGMHGEEGVVKQIHDSLVNIQRAHSQVDIFYSVIPVHSKCYVWRKDGSIVQALLGSANFSQTALTTPFREVLAETTKDTFEPLNKYLRYVLDRSKSCLESDVKIKGVASQPKSEAHIPSGQTTCRVTLLDPRTNEVQLSNGLNWGQGARGHTNPNDANIPIRTSYLRSFPGLFPPKQEISLLDQDEGRRSRNNDSVEVIWDDGVIMRGLLEGSQWIDDVRYPKQFCSFPNKSEMGEYFRYRLGVPSGQPVRKIHLDSYGRSDIEITLLEEGVYYFDFSA